MDIKTQLPNDVLLSTVFIESMNQFESCWFFGNTDEEHFCDSEVVAHYDTESEAFDGHIKLLTEKMPSIDWHDTFKFLRGAPQIDMTVN